MDPALERFLDTPGEVLADRLAILLARPEPLSIGAILKVFAEWLDDVELERTVIVSNPRRGEDWHPQPPSVSFLRRDLHRAAARPGR